MRASQSNKTKTKIINACRKKIFIFMGQSLFITWESEDFLGDHMVSGGNQGEGGAGFSTRRGNSEKIYCQSYGIIRTLQSLMGGGGGLRKV